MSQVYLVTGASTGFGALTARALAKKGHTVFAGMYTHDGNTAPYEAELQKFATERKVDLRAVSLDLLSQSSCDAAVKHILDTAGKIDAIVHNAGHMCFGPAESFTPEQYLRILDVNAVGCQRLNMAALPHMRARRSGHLIWVSSSSAYGAKSPWLAPYFAAKVAMDSLAQSYAHELMPWGIETTIVMPGLYTSGTNHFVDAAHPGRADVAREYADGPTRGLEERLNQAMEVPMNGFEELGKDISVVSDAVAELSLVERGRKLFRIFPDEQGDGSRAGTLLVDLNRENAFRRFGLEGYLKVDLEGA